MEHYKQRQKNRRITARDYAVERTNEVFGGRNGCVEEVIIIDKVVETYSK